LERTPEEKKVSLTVVIPLRVTRARLDLIDRITYYRHDYKIPDTVAVLVVDDGSRPEDFAALKEREDGKRLRVISTGRKHYNVFSPALARNIGAQVAEGEFLLFLDADLSPYPGFFDDILREIKINDMDKEATNFLMCPVIYLTERGYTLYKDLDPDLPI